MLPYCNSLMLQNGNTAILQYCNIVILEYCNIAILRYCKLSEACVGIAGPLMHHLLLIKTVIWGGTAGSFELRTTCRDGAVVAVGGREENQCKLVKNHGKIDA